MARWLEHWREIYERVPTARDRQDQLALCKMCRWSMHRRLIALAAHSDSPDDVAENEAIEEALRALWKIEQNVPATVSSPEHSKL